MVLAAAVAVVARGGFPDAARALFALLAGSALLATALRRPDEVLRAVRAPAVLVLAGLAILAAASASWTIGEPSDAVRYGLVVAGYGALATCAAVAAGERRGLSAIYATIAGLAALSGLVGLFGAGVQEFPYGQRIGGSWQAAGTFEYGPVNALLQVAALPILLTAMAGRNRPVALAAAAGAAIAGAIIGLSDSLYNELAAAAVLVVAVAFPKATIGGSRGLAAAAALVVIAAALGAHLIAGGYAPLCERDGEGARVAALAMLPVAAAASWALARSPLGGERSPSRWPLCALAAAAAIAIGGAAIDPERTCHAPTRAVQPYAGLLHGRLVLWEAAYEAALDRPLGGSGADTYAIASAPYQDEDRVLFAHDLPIELWAELGIAGAVAALALYAAVVLALARARRTPALWLAGPAVAGFLLANLVDFPWHLAGAGAVWALALGAVIAAGLGSSGTS
jgi:O-Antigen ligase